MNGSGKHILMAGAGAIGSSLASLLAVMESVSKLTIIDFDKFEPTNLHSQNIVPSDVHSPKALALSRQVHRLNPSLKTTPIVARIETVPLGLLRADAWLTAFDSRVARMHANVRAFQLRIPIWIDGGVRPQNKLARASTFFPSDSDSACMECSWGEADYAALSSAISCHGVPSVPSSRSPKWLGFLAAAMMAQHCYGLLVERNRDPRLARNFVLDAGSHRAWSSRLERNQACRCPHESLAPEFIRRAPEETPLDDLLKLGQLSLPGMPFIRGLVCAACRSRRPFVYVQSRLDERNLGCDRCGGQLGYLATDLLNALGAGDLEGKQRGASLADVGIQAGDILRAGPALYELACSNSMEAGEGVR